MNQEPPQEPLVSVVMPAKNEKRYIGTAIESVLQQTYQNLELIVVDDYSTDRTAEVVRSFNDRRVILYEKKSEPAGVSASKNIGIARSKGSFVAYQDADDYSLADRIELQVKEAVSGKKTRVVGSWIEQRIGENSRVWQLPVAHEDIVAGFNRFYNRVTFVSGTMLFPRAVGLKVPNRVQFKCFEDWDQLCRLSESGDVEFRNVPKVLFVYNIRPKGSKGRGDWSRYNILERACRARRFAGLPEWESVEDLEAYMASSPGAFLRWEGLRRLLELKVTLERLRISRMAKAAKLRVEHLPLGSQMVLPRHQSREAALQEDQD
jgi:glycosyltransferase involved in cell wall biosynthesis